MTLDINVPHLYQAWVDENDCGNTWCLAPPNDPIHFHPRRIELDV